MQYMLVYQYVRVFIMFLIMGRETEKESAYLRNLTIFTVWAPRLWFHNEYSTLPQE